MNSDPVVDLQSFTICADGVVERANVACCNMQVGKLIITGCQLRHPALFVNKEKHNMKFLFIEVKQNNEKHVALFRSEDQSRELYIASNNS
jgi:hypothetical protein